MEVITDTEEIELDRNTVMTVGTFDGVHEGHREIIARLNRVKQEKGYRSVLVTFDPHPQIVLRNRPKEVKLLNTTDEKLGILSGLGIDITCIIKFTKEFSQTEAKDFYVNYLIKKIGLSELVLGYDHMFGKNRGGSFETLKELSGEYGFTVDKVGEHKVEGEHVSSTAIRSLLDEGNVKKAAKFLGYDYFLQGEVVNGDKRGREIGFPTANLKLNSENKAVPANGIYAVRAEVEGGKYEGMMYIGLNETFADSEDDGLRLEVNLFDFDKDIYGKNVKVEFIEYIRGDKKFGSAEELVKQINSDKEKTKQILNN